jgi:hypothetical protein
MALLNPELREPGAGPGEARHWTLSSVCGAARIAAFGPAPHTAHDGFEGWAPFVDAFGTGALVLALFAPTPKGYESFAAWNGGPLLEELPTAVAEACVFDGGEVEPFDRWPDAVWVRSWAEVSSASAPLDDFEAWAPSTSPAWAAAAFAPGGAAAEAFAGTWPALKGL